MLKYLRNREIYTVIIESLVPKTKKSLWIATADIKDIYTKKGNRFVPFLEILSDLVTKGVEIRLLYAKEPGEAFQKDFDRYPNLINGIEKILCPRVHLKMILSDTNEAYLGSANLTGAGVGAKSEHKRNFEFGILTDDMQIVDAALEQFDSIWRGDHCRPCARKEFCSMYDEILGTN